MVPARGRPPLDAMLPAMHNQGDGMTSDGMGKVWQWDHDIWVNYHALTATEPWESCLVREIIPFYGLNSA